MASGGGDQLDNEELRRVNADLRDIYIELFMGDDSDEEFERFTSSDINDNDGDTDEFSCDTTWIGGDRVTTELNFSGSSGIQAPIPDNPEVIDFVKLFFNDSDFEVCKIILRKCTTLSIFKG